MTIKTILLLGTIFLTYACTNGQNKHKENQFSAPEVSADTLIELTLEQDAAFEALNAIQIQGYHLYSTFAGLDHDCFPADSSFVLSRSELQLALEELLKLYYKDISPNKQAKLTSAAVMAQEEYLVMECRSYSPVLIANENKNIPTSGSWILPKVLGHRDVIIEW